LRDVRVAQAREDLPFALETRQAIAIHAWEVQQLDRGTALEAAIDAPREPDGAHPTCTDQRFELVRADRLTGDLGPKGHTGAMEQLALLEERPQVGRDLGIEPAQPVVELRRVHFESLVQQRFELLPLIASECGDPFDALQRIETNPVFVALSAVPSRHPIQRFALRQGGDHVLDLAFVTHGPSHP
jgi:hypothetical protein